MITWHAMPKQIYRPEKGIKVFQRSMDHLYVFFRMTKPVIYPILKLKNTPKLCYLKSELYHHYWNEFSKGILNRKKTP